jgi:hypothetical protein
MHVCVCGLAFIINRGRAQSGSSTKQHVPNIQHPNIANIQLGSTESTVKATVPNIPTSSCNCKPFHLHVSDKRLNHSPFEALRECLGGQQCKVPREAVKSLTIWKMPRTLIVHLKRFYFEGPFRSKLNTKVSFPLEGLVIPDPSNGIGNKKSYVFVMRAVTCYFPILSPAISRFPLSAVSRFLLSAPAPTVLVYTHLQLQLHQLFPFDTFHDICTCAASTRACSCTPCTIAMLCCYYMRSLCSSCYL